MEYTHFVNSWFEIPDEQFGSSIIHSIQIPQFLTNTCPTDHNKEYLAQPNMLDNSVYDYLEQFGDLAQSELLIIPK